MSRRGCSSPKSMLLVTARHVRACCNACGAQVPVLPLFPGSVTFAAPRVTPGKACDPVHLFAVQWLIYNDCLFRWRHTYDHILFVDRDEFLHFPGKPAGEVHPSTDALTLLNRTVGLHGNTPPGTGILLKNN